MIFFRVLLIGSLVALYGCADKTTSEQTAADSVLVVPDSTPAIPGMDDAAAVNVPRTIIPEDTMKAIKVVYVTNKEGTTVYAQMDHNTELESILPFGQELDVLEEHKEWYKVRFRNNSEIYIYYVFKEYTSSENPVGITLFYPEFKMIFFGFIYDEEYTNTNRFYQQNGVDGSQAQIIKEDTISLYETLKSYQVIKRIQCVPKNKSDRFVVSLAYGQLLYEVKELTHENADNKIMQWFELTPYKVLPDTGGIFLPRSNGNLTKGEGDLYRNAMAKKHHMKDTIVTIPGEYEINTEYVHKNRYFCYDLGSFYLKVQRFSGDRLIETRYITISLQESGC
ncbi:hypothetical protein [Cytophaga aurantiaca]|uniref:hypothetical protein n=1 Tax=Cytophaga aurantiaca TaxID=29530 RepID=UPI000372E3F2|nr:hypothetical protein [Cytophaga aurantiaca]